MRVGINGFGRMGRLALRAAWQRDDLDIVAINEPNGTAEVMATLLEFDTIHGRFAFDCRHDGDEATLVVDVGDGQTGSVRAESGHRIEEEPVAAR